MSDSILPSQIDKNHKKKYKGKHIKKTEKKYVLPHFNNSKELVEDIIYCVLCNKYRNYNSYSSIRFDDNGESSCSDTHQSLSSIIDFMSKAIDEQYETINKMLIEHQEIEEKYDEVEEMSKKYKSTSLHRDELGELDTEMFELRESIIQTCYDEIFKPCAIFQRMDCLEGAENYVNEIIRYYNDIEE